MLDRVERAGLLERRRGTRDRRLVVASLTEEGRRMEQRAVEVQTTIRCQLGMTSEARASLRQELRALVTVLDPGSDAAAEAEPLALH